MTTYALAAASYNGEVRMVALPEQRVAIFDFTALGADAGTIQASINKHVAKDGELTDTEAMFFMSWVYLAVKIGLKGCGFSFVQGATEAQVRQLMADFQATYAA